MRFAFNPLTGRFDVVSTPGAGAPASASTATPTFVPAGQTVTVARYSQMLYETVIDCEGVLDLDGILVEVG